MSNVCTTKPLAALNLKNDKIREVAIPALNNQLENSEYRGKIIVPIGDGKCVFHLRVDIQTAAETGIFPADVLDIPQGELFTGGFRKCRIFYTAISRKYCLAFVCESSRMVFIDNTLLYFLISFITEVPYTLTYPSYPL